MQKQRGFTLIELLVVISIISLLSSIVLSALSTARDKAKIAGGLQFDSSTHNALGDRVIGEWLFDEASGSTAIDTSGFGHNGTISAGATRVSGVVRGALNFPTGSSNLVSVGDLGTFPTQGTLSFWMNPSVVASFANVLSTNNSGNIGIRFEETTSGNLSAVMGNDTGTYTPHVYIASGMQTNHWYQITLVWDTSLNTVQGYLNGAKVFNDTQTYWPTGITNMSIGVGFGSRYYSGILDEVRIYGATLTSMQVQNLYAQEKVNHIDLAVNKQ